MTDVKLPGLGPVNKKALGIAALVGAGVLGFAYLRKRKSGSASSSASSGATSADTVNTDPQTGYPYGSAEDAAALQAQDSGINTNTPYGGGGAYIDPATGLPYPAPTGNTAITTNSEWEQQAIGDLASAGYSSQQLSDATNGLGRYLAHLPMSSDDQTLMVQIAVGLEGQPPTGGPYNIIPAPPSPAAPKPAASSTVTVPNVTGKITGTATTDLAAAGLVGHITNPGGLTPQNSRVNSQTPGPGKAAHKGSVVDLHIVRN